MAQGRYTARKLTTTRATPAAEGQAAEPGRYVADLGAGLNSARQSAATCAPGCGAEHCPQVNGDAAAMRTRWSVSAGSPHTAVPLGLHVER
jgi:hypothetical protein